MNSPLIPKERLTAFQRWELASFDAAEPAFETEAASTAHPADARAAAHALGYSEGLAQGLAEGRAQSDAHAAQLAALLNGLRTELSAAPFTLAEDTLALALDLARTLVRSTLETDPERILPVVREALAALPRVAQPATLTLNPQDAARVRERLATDLADWRIREDAQLARGGCRVETAESRIDASIEQRWEKLSRALGRPSPWALPPRLPDDDADDLADDTEIDPGIDTANDEERAQ